MSRKPRIHIPGGIYHVTLRGNHRQPIFASDHDREVLDDIVGKVTGQLEAKIHAYCWMTNHLHLVVQVGDASLGRVMQRVATRYARYFQHTLATTGHLFERRYHDVLIEADSQFLQTVRYVHLNPVDAGLVRDPAEYRWSGHRGYLGLGSPPWLRTDLVLAMFHGEGARARAAYSRFLVEAGNECGCDTEKAAGVTLLGATASRQNLVSLSVPAAPRVAETLDELIARICAEEEVSAAQLADPSKNRRLARCRTRIAIEATGTGISTLSEVARRFDRHVASLSKAIARHRWPGRHER